jgi:hypothetical protein
VASAGGGDGGAGKGSGGPGRGGGGLGRGKAEKTTPERVADRNLSAAKKAIERIAEARGQDAPSSDPHLISTSHGLEECGTCARYSILSSLLTASDVNIPRKLRENIPLATPKTCIYRNTRESEFDREVCGSGVYGSGDLRGYDFFPWDGIFMGQFSPSVALKMYNNSPRLQTGFPIDVHPRLVTLNLGMKSIVSQDSIENLPAVLPCVDKVCNGCSTCSSFIT